MTAPTRTRPAPTRRAPRTAPAARPHGGARSAAAQRAYSRKTERTQRWRHLVPDPLSNATVARRVPFVALVIGLLGLGLVATLWLSTNAAEGSYQLSNAQQENTQLAQQAESLHRDVATMDSAAALARRAAELGMVPTTDVAHLLVAPDGAVTVVGKPAPATAPTGAPAPPPPPAPVAVQPVMPKPAPTAATPAPSAPVPAASATASAPDPAPGAPTPPPPAPQAHSEQIQPGPTPVPVRGGA